LFLVVYIYFKYVLHVNKCAVTCVIAYVRKHACILIPCTVNTS